MAAAIQIFFVLFVFAFDKFQAQDCEEKFTRCNEELAKIPECDGKEPSKVVTCLQNMLGDCHNDPSATEALSNIKLLQKIGCENKALMTDFKEDCWIELQKCSTIISGVNATVKRDETLCSQKKKELQDCKVTKMKAECRDPTSKLFDKILNHHICGAMNVVVQMFLFISCLFLTRIFT